MAQVLSLKELRSSAALKTEISKLEQENAQCLEQLERQKLVERKLREDLVDQKKDFEHLEKQFDHFAGIEAEFEALQQEIQMERLEQLIDSDKKEASSKAAIKKAKDELKEAQDELRELKLLDPLRLKRQVADLKKKAQEQATANQNLNTALVAARKELKETSAEKERLDTELTKSRNGGDFFWQSTDGRWKLYESAIVLPFETEQDVDTSKRICCLDSETGLRVLSAFAPVGENAEWFGAITIPDDVSAEAGKRLLSIAAELEEAQDKS